MLRVSSDISVDRTARWHKFRLLSDHCLIHSSFVAGTGRTGYLQVPPNNYPFYSDDEKYMPVMQSDGGQLSGVMV